MTPAITVTVLPILRIELNQNVQAAVSQRRRELWVGLDGGLVWRNLIPVVFNNNNNSDKSSFTELTIACTYRAVRVKT